MRSVMFDLDGTLADTSGDLLAAGFDWDEDLVDAEYPKFIEAYAADLDTHTTLYPGAMDAVEALKMAGYKVGICTNKPIRQAEDLMTLLGVRDAFGSLLGSDSLPVRKPDPEHLRETVRRAGGDPALTLLVGDTITDRETARNAGVPSVLVTFGPGDDDVHALEPEATLDHYDHLPDLVTRLIG